MAWEMLDPIVGFLSLIIAALLGYFVYDYFRYVFPNHLVKMVHWRIKRTFPEDVPGIFFDFLNDHYEEKSTIKQIRNAIDFLAQLRRLDVPPCVDRQEIDEGDGL